MNIVSLIGGNTMKQINFQAIRRENNIGCLNGQGRKLEMQDFSEHPMRPKLD